MKKSKKAFDDFLKAAFKPPSKKTVRESRKMMTQEQRDAIDEWARTRRAVEKVLFKKIKPQKTARGILYYIRSGAL